MKTYNGRMYRVRDLGTLSAKWEAFIKPLSSGLREVCRRGGSKYCKSQQGWRIPKKQCLTDTAGLEHIWPHREYGSRHSTYTGPSQIVFHCWEWNSAWAHDCTDKGTCHQDWWTKFCPQEQGTTLWKKKKKHPTPASFPLTFTWESWHMCTHT